MVGAGAVAPLPTLRFLLSGRALAPSLRANGSARSAARWQAPRSNPNRGRGCSLDCFVASLLAM